MKKFLLIAALCALSTQVMAKDWIVDPAQSKLTFAGEQNGEEFQGGFKKFTAQIALDPAQPESGKISVLVDIASAYAGSADRDEMLPQAEWFNTSKFPQAQFTTTAIRKTASGYEADGALTIKGIAKNITLPFTLAPEGDPKTGPWRATGHVTLMRNDFTIGQGSYANEDYVKHAVIVGIDLIAKPAP